MIDEYRRYKKEVEALNRMLETAGHSIDQIADRMKNRAVLAYPDAADVTDLGAIHKQLTDRVDRLIDKMEQVQKDLNDARAKALSK